IPMHHFPTSYTYHQWDGTGDEFLNPEDMMESLSEDLLHHGDIDLALQRAFRWGFQNRDGQHSDGLRDLLNRLRQQRQEMLDRWDFNSITEDIQERLDQILDQERSTIQEKKAQLDRQAAVDSALDTDAAKQFLDRKETSLEDLPESTAAQIQQLREYGFVDQQAQADFDKLLQELQQQVADSLFNNMKGAMGGGEDGSGSMEEMKEFLKDINDAFEAQRNGEQVDLDKLNNRWANQMGGRIDSLEELAQRMRQRLAAAQAMMNMLSPQQRADLMKMMQQAMQDAGLAGELGRLQENLGPIRAPRGLQQSDAHGAEPLSIDMATSILQQANQMGRLENQLRSVSRLEELDGIDPKLLDEVLNDEDKAWLDRWQHIEQELQDSGYVNQTDRGLELTPRAVRKIGEKALADIFGQLKQNGIGDHDLDNRGVGGELADTTSQWEFGDPFQLDLAKSVMNAIMREGPGAPVHLRPDDFEVVDRDAKTSTATVLLVDMSRSMIHNGCWEAAKRAALALDTLIRGKYPRDMLELIGFSSTAHPLKVTDLPSLEWNEYTYGTNLQHALQLARELLASQRGRNRQIIVITDGEPTAHITDGEVFFDYPPTRETFEATLKEVVRCTRDGITINTFLLEQTPYMARFIEDLMRVNRGRVINASPNALGSYVLRDFVRGRTVQRFAS
ncbi:MAG TPA: VWA domain-containing protein, partial [Thermomicrobiales bacterium]|nr:VWA domain-containing protein [Thermomicrobiales bacterium]